MLVLQRKMYERIMIGHDVVIQVVSLGDRKVRLGITAPPELEVHREEVYNSIYNIPDNKTK